MSHPTPERGSVPESFSVVQLLRRLADIPTQDREPVEDAADDSDQQAEFFRNNWREARDGLLSRTRKIRVQPQASRSPTLFHFELDRPYKKKCEDGGVELAPGPVRGLICYRPDPFTSVPGQAAVAVLIDPSLGLYHPNHSRVFGGQLCLGDLHGTPALQPLLEHIWGILSYTNLTVSHPADAEASAFFSVPEARDGLPPAEPLY